MKKKSKSSSSGERRTGPGEVYDTEVHCTRCGTRLYVSPEGATLVLASLKSTDVAGLVCLCGHTEFIDAALRPVVVRMKNRRHD
jgi:hypothetical protein